MNLKFWVFGVLVSLSIWKLAAQSTNTQKQVSSLNFSANPTQKYGFDTYQKNWGSHYPSFQINLNLKGFLAYKSLAPNETDKVDVIYKSKVKIKKGSLKFEVDQVEIPFKQINDTLFTLNLPKSLKNYYVIGSYENKVLAKLFVSILKEKREKVILVPLSEFKLNLNSIQNQINTIYRQANLQIDLHLAPSFKSKVFNDTIIFGTPDKENKRYSGQMRLLRDLYFEANPKADKKANYVFVVHQFSDSTLTGFMVRNKSVGLVKNNLDVKQLSISLAQTLAFGIGKLNHSWLDEGPEKGTSTNLMDINLGTDLCHFQWDEMQHSGTTFSFYDDEENVQTNNGTVAYYFWEEDRFGNIQLSSKNFIDNIKRPYKKNYLAHRFNVKYQFLMPFYKIGVYYINLLTLVFFALVLYFSYYLRKRLKSFWQRKLMKRKFLRRILYIPLIIANIYILLLSFDLSNFILDHYTVVSGPIPELENLEYKSARHDLLTNKQLKHKEEYGLCSEILIRQNKNWLVKKRNKVLYFEIKKNKKQQYSMRFQANSDSLILEKMDYRILASSHYFVFNYLDSNGLITKQEVYNYYGKNITGKLKNEDVPKRILLFVNGYRPTSIGHTFEENFNDVQKNGLEFPNSKNLIYDFDRYDYWEQWNQVNLLFQNRLNPTETYYADGHFSVSTSNYRSLLNFTNVSSKYPKRCRNPKKHDCYYWKNPSLKDRFFNETSTINQLKFRANRKGFQLRRKKGQLAGKNLLQILNDIPNKSANDTLFIVAHSMGYAYALGIVDELRSKVNFGGFYIIAPENAKSGRIKEEEWGEVWQYGVNFNSKTHDAPCLQDGVAPQSKVSGLSDSKRVYFPKSLYLKKGFFNSHFIGNYTWVLKIKEGKKGYIQQH